MKIQAYSLETMLHHHWLEILVVCALLILFIIYSEYKPFKVAAKSLVSINN